MGLAVVAVGALLVADRPVGDHEVLVSKGVFRLPPDNPGELGDGLVMLPLACQRDAQPEVAQTTTSGRHPAEDGARATVNRVRPNQERLGRPPGWSRIAFEGGAIASSSFC